ncbi:hypothetical protein [Fictibacillus barbaricus]|uniref:Uncharacterized protein n=1 Tax=Fictibacillus barbaricus TaxID=182136 RepID=A0ABU1TX01_9BACL|nr:hypothetical protein [Fictibacillus barbaricus]MDR7071721.1 hypothetical protein [Fictibacillus barbaricus]
MFFIIHFVYDYNLASLITVAIAWICIGILTYHIYKKQKIKPKIWKVFIILAVGFVSFSFDINMLHTKVKIPIIPLGVWLLYLYFRKKEVRWQMYRRFAWIGFFANFIFLASTLASVPIYNAMYPENELSTYLAKVKNPAIIQLHPSAKNDSLNGNFVKIIKQMKPAEMHSDEWFNGTVTMKMKQKDRKEKFPYQLTGVVPEWGSDIEPLIYMEKDGKGLLITSHHKQYYFRSNQSLLKGEN